MRTILIPLILICSLTQFESVQAGQISLNDDPYSYSCGTLYNCYVPAACENVDSVTMAEVTANVVVEVIATTKIADNCPAILRYHLYAESWAHVIINSLQPLEDVKSIEFVQETASKKKLVVSCIFANDIITGKHGKKTKFENDDKTKMKNLLCEMEAKASSRTGDVLDTPNKNVDFISFKIDGQSTKLPFKLAMSNTRFCDPRNLQFRDEKSTTNIYKKIEVKPGAYYCDAPYEIEYRLDSGVNKTLDAIKCQSADFVLDGVAITDPDKILKMRCVAEAKYFCNYLPKLKDGEEKPQLTTSMWQKDEAQRKETQLKCPKEKPHLVITGDGGDKTIKNAVFECKNYGKQQFWVVNKKMFTKKGPEIYCTNKLDCKRFLTIPTSQVKNGRINAKKLPECDTNAKLNVDDKEVVDTGCNEDTGQFYYSVVAGQQVPITDDTQFACKYDTSKEQEKAAETKAAQTKLLTGGGIGAGVAAALLCGAIAFGCFYFTKRKLVANEKKQKALEDATLLEYGMNADEKRLQKELNKEKRKKEKADEEERRKNTLVYRLLGKRAADISSSISNQPSSSNNDAPTNQAVDWNPLMMSRMHESHNVTIQDSRTGAKIEAVYFKGPLRDSPLDKKTAAWNAGIKRHAKIKNKDDEKHAAEYVKELMGEYGIAVKYNNERINPTPKEEVKKEGTKKEDAKKEDAKKEGAKETKS